MATISTSDLMVALVQASSNVPAFFLSVFARALADNLSRRRVMFAGRCMGARGDSRLQILDGRRRRSQRSRLVGLGWRYGGATRCSRCRLSGELRNGPPVLPHHGMLPNDSSVASRECSPGLRPFSWPLSSRSRPTAAHQTPSCELFFASYLHPALYRAQKEIGVLLWVLRLQTLEQFPARPPRFFVKPSPQFVGHSCKKGQVAAVLAFALVSASRSGGFRPPSTQFAILRGTDRAPAR